jgi:RNA polymerase sigma-70 factor (sigma-E family)
MERQVAAAMNDGDTQRADAECATRVMVGARGDVAFRSLYRERYVSMVRLAALLVDRLELAEEIVQDCFAAVYQRWDEIESPAAYLRTTVVNRCRDDLRRRRLERRPTGLPEPAVDAPNEMADAVAALPHRQRMAVVLRFYEDMTVDEIAEAMHARPGTVKSWLSRAMTQLRQEIPR